MRGLNVGASETWRLLHYGSLVWFTVLVIIWIYPDSHFIVAQSPFLSLLFFQVFLISAVVTAAIYGKYYRIRKESES